MHPTYAEATIDPVVSLYHLWACLGYRVFKWMEED
jgi:hypothetical protein